MRADESFVGGGADYAELLPGAGGLKPLCRPASRRWAIVIGVAFPRFRVDQAIRFFFKIPTLIGIMSIVYAQMLLTS